MRTSIKIILMLTILSGTIFGSMVLFAPKISQAAVAYCGSEPPCPEDSTAPRKKGCFIVRLHKKLANAMLSCCGPKDGLGYKLAKYGTCPVGPLGLVRLIGNGDPDEPPLPPDPELPCHVCVTNLAPPGCWQICTPDPK